MLHLETSVLVQLKKEGSIRLKDQGCVNEAINKAHLKDSVYLLQDLRFFPLLKVTRFVQHYTKVLFGAC